MDADEVFEPGAASAAAPAPRSLERRREDRSIGRRNGPPPRQPREDICRNGRAKQDGSRKKTGGRRRQEGAGQPDADEPCREDLMSGYEVIVHATADEVAEALAHRLIARLAELQRDFRIPAGGLTGGRIATRAYRQLAEEGAHSAVDWSRVELWWGDERFVPAGDPDRNAKPAPGHPSAALALDPERVHPMPASDAGLDLDAAADAYARELGATAFDICLLGMGPDGHVASIFPEHPSSYAEGDVIARPRLTEAAAGADQSRPCR